MVFGGLLARRRDTASEASSSRQRLIEDINKDLPAGLDWKAGALRYVNDFLENTADKAAATKFMTTKPFNTIGDNQQASIAGLIWYVGNFLNTVQLLNLPRGSHILDVACGAGWLSDLLSRIGYVPYGVDLSREFIELARERIEALEGRPMDERFLTMDIEIEPLPSTVHGKFSAAIFESCLHHFHDPLTAIEHIGQELTKDGLLVILEGENRRGPIKDEYVNVMTETHTLERPYSREQLLRILDMTGFPEREVVASINGFFGSKQWDTMNDYARTMAEGRNYVIAARSKEALARIL
ncbi:MAG: class I SAM-dependent methyltransferase [Rhodomicrobiaceae bacterium]